MNVSNKECIIGERGVVSLRIVLSSEVAGSSKGVSKGVYACAKGQIYSWFISIGKSVHDDIGGLYMEGVILGCVSLDSDECVPIVYA
jgi:hypothetical protein